MRLKRRAGAAAPFGLGVALLVLQACHKPAPLVDWQDVSSVPVSVRENLEIAAVGKGQGRSTSLSLICGAAGDLHLLLRTRLPEPRNLRVPWTDHPTIIVNRNLKQELAIDTTLLALGPVDTILTPELTEPQLGQLARMIGSPPSQDVVFGLIEETSFAMRGTADEAAIRNFALRCSDRDLAPARPKASPER